MELENLTELSSLFRRFEPNQGILLEAAKYLCLSTDSATCSIVLGIAEILKMKKAPKQSVHQLNMVQSIHLLLMQTLPVLFKSSKPLVTFRQDPSVSTSAFASAEHSSKEPIHELLLYLVFKDFFSFVLNSTTFPFEFLTVLFKLMKFLIFMFL
jgi:hypothetical protein